MVKEQPQTIHTVPGQRQTAALPTPCLSVPITHSTATYTASLNLVDTLWRSPLTLPEAPPSPCLSLGGGAGCDQI